MSKSVDFHGQASSNPSLTYPTAPGSDINPGSDTNSAEDINSGGDVNRGLQNRTDVNSDINRMDPTLNPMDPNRVNDQMDKVNSVNPTQVTGPQTAPLTGPK